MYNYSVSLIIPAANQLAANKLACALGFDVLPGNTFSVPLSSDGENVTHYGAHTYAEQSFVDMLNSAKAGILPPVLWTDYELDEAKAGAAVAALIDVAQIGTAQDTWPVAMALSAVTKYEPQEVTT